MCILRFLVLSLVFFVLFFILGEVGIRFFFFQAEDGIRDLVRSRGLGDVYKRQRLDTLTGIFGIGQAPTGSKDPFALRRSAIGILRFCLLYTSDAADERSSVDLGGRRIIKKKTTVWRAKLTQSYT